MGLNRILGIVALLLCLVSVWSYRDSVSRAKRFERGQKFLSQLNPDNIQTVEITKEGNTVSLRRENDRFTVASAHNYPAKNEAVNRFIRDTLEIGLDKKVGSSESLVKELEVDPASATATQIVFKDNSKKEMVRFIVGKATEDGRGNYIRRLGSEDNAIYLTSKGIYLSTADDNFLDKQLLDVNSSEIARIQGSDFTFSEVDGALQLDEVPKGKQAKSTETSQVKNLLSGLNFDKVFLADDPEVAGLRFDHQVQVDLKDHSGYTLSLAKKDDKSYLTVAGTFDISEIQLEKDESEEALKEKADILSRGDEINKFNNFHGSWVYQLSDLAAGKMLKTKKDLVEDPPKPTE